MAAFAPKALEGGEDTIWAHRDPPHSESSPLSLEEAG